MAEKLKSVRRSRKIKRGESGNWPASPSASVQACLAVKSEVVTICTGEARYSGRQPMNHMRATTQGGAPAAHVTYQRTEIMGLQCYNTTRGPYINFAITLWRNFCTFSSWWLFQFQSNFNHATTHNTSQSSIIQQNGHASKILSHITYSLSPITYRLSPITYHLSPTYAIYLPT